VPPRKKKLRANLKAAALSPTALAEQAHQALETGRFRDAGEHFKALLKLGDHPEHQAGLAAAYEGRARELSAKGMLKEALVMWENRAGLGEGIAFEPDHAALLLHMDRVEAVLALFTGKDAMPPADLPFAKRLAKTPARPRARGTSGPSSHRSSKPARRSRPREAGDRRRLPPPARLG